MSNSKPDQAPTIDQVIAINEMNLQGEMALCPSWYFYYANLKVEAEESADAAILAVETYEAQLAYTIKESPGIYGSDLTQTEIKRIFRADDKWKQLRTEENKLKKNTRIMYEATKALEMKSRMLMSMNKRDTNINK